MRAAPSIRRCASISTRTSGVTPSALELQIQGAVERRVEHHTEDGDRDEARDPRYGVVDARGDAGMISRHRVHHRRRQRRDARRHTATKNDDSGEKRRPVRSADARPAKQRKAQCGDERPDDERRSCSVAIEEAAGPARQQEHQHDEGQERGAGGGRRVPLDLHQVERKEEENTAQCRVQKKREQVGPAEAARAKERQRQHGRTCSALDEQKTAEQHDPAGAGQVDRFNQPEHERPKAARRQHEPWPVELRRSCATATPELSRWQSRRRRAPGGD